MSSGNHQCLHDCRGTVPALLRSLDPHFPAQALSEETRALCAPCPWQPTEPHVGAGHWDGGWTSPHGRPCEPEHSFEMGDMVAVRRDAQPWLFRGPESLGRPAQAPTLTGHVTVPAAIPVQEPAGTVLTGRTATHHGARSAARRSLHMSATGERCNPKFSHRPDNPTATQHLGLRPGSSVQTVLGEESELSRNSGRVTHTGQM